VSSAHCTAASLLDSALVVRWMQLCDTRFAYVVSKHNTALPAWPAEVAQAPSAAAASDVFQFPARSLAA
jgi:hypothetical protein